MDLRLVLSLDPQKWKDVLCWFGSWKQTLVVSGHGHLSTYKLSPGWNADLTNQNRDWKWCHENGFSPVFVTMCQQLGVADHYAVSLSIWQRLRRATSRSVVNIWVWYCHWSIITMHNSFHGDNLNVGTCPEPSSFPDKGLVPRIQFSVVPVRGSMQDMASLDPRSNPRGRVWGITLLGSV